MSNSVEHQHNPALGVEQLKTFVGTKDYDLSRGFYCALGWEVRYEDEGLAVMGFATQEFYLQRYYQEEWCNNMMMHLTVADVSAWYEHINSVLTESGYAPARVTQPKREPYGADVCYCWDPSGVLWHVAQFL